MYELTLKQKLGQSVAVYARIRDEDRKLLRIIRENSIGLFIGYSRDTTSFHNYLDGNSRRQRITAIADAIDLDIVEKAIDEVCLTMCYLVLYIHGIFQGCFLFRAFPMFGCY